MDPATLKDVNVSTSRGRIWADEAIALLEQNPAPSLPLLQGLYCLFVYEGNIGSGERSVHYWRRAMQVYQSLNEHPYKVSDKRKNAKRLEQERHAISWCMWGFYCCEWYVFHGWETYRALLTKVPPPYEGNASFRLPKANQPTKDREIVA